jgi:hypothetical protein
MKTLPVNGASKSNFSFQSPQDVWSFFCGLSDAFTLAVMVGVICRLNLRLRPNRVTAQKPNTSPAKPPKTDTLFPHPEVPPNHNPPTAPSKSVAIGSRYMMAAPLKRLAEDMLILTTSPTPASMALITWLSSLPLVDRQPRHLPGPEWQPPQALLRSVTTRAIPFISFSITIPICSAILPLPDSLYIPIVAGTRCPFHQRPRALYFYCPSPVGSMLLVKRE